MTQGERHSAVEIIRAKRDGYELSDAQIDWAIGNYVRGAVAEEQMSALAMAIVFRGMTVREAARWTSAMVDSGERIDLSSLPGKTPAHSASTPLPKSVDKHSTGGVGDKVTLILTPLVSACGLAIPQLSGRGLGHTGGTLDKLESIPGWHARLSNKEIRTQLHEISAVICAATEGIVPADRKLYALRDVTGTVESIPLIASSIMSKKIAEGTSALVLDVKVGSGAFMKNVEDARELAETMVSLGERNGVRTGALLTDMSVPLGRAVGNAVEVTESVEVLRGAHAGDDLVKLTLELAREMLALTGVSEADPAEVLASGRAYEQWRRMITAQGGDPDAALPVAPYTHVVRAPTSGVMTRLDAYAVGLAAWRLGAGRSRQEDDVAPAAGIWCHAKPGEHVTQGNGILELYTDREESIPDALAALDGAFTIDPAGAQGVRSLILDRIP